MTDQFSKIIEENPIGKGLDAFRASFHSACEGAGLLYYQDALQQLNREGKKTQLYSSCLLTVV